MRIPFWQRDLAHPTKAIDRIQDSRTSRQLIGSWVAEDFSRVESALVNVKGAGKFARYRELQGCRQELESSAKQMLCDLVRNPDPTEQDVQFGASELTGYLTNNVLSLISSSGVPASEILALGVVDPGLSLIDFEGQEVSRSLVQPLELASKTSITVIDRFADRDRIDGGNGSHLFALAYWFLLSDRNPRIAEENRVLILERNEVLDLYYLPASDGLDAVLPDIQWLSIGLSNEPVSENVSQQVCRQVNELAARDPSLSMRVLTSISTVPLELDGLEDRMVVSSLEDQGIQHLDAVASACLANAFVDQLPVSLPHLSGNPNPKILGALTPGSLVNFRNFVLQASKVTPGIMKLRDAI